MKYPKGYRPTPIRQQLSKCYKKCDALQAQVKAGQALAEAIEAEKRLWALQDGDLKGALWPSGDILERYQRLADVKCLQALADWHEAKGE